MRSRIRYNPAPICILGLTCAIWSLSHCGPSGISDDAALELVNVSGSIKSSAGRQSDMQNWTILTLERDTNIARSSLISESGTFEIPNVINERPRTIALLSPDHLLRSILSIPTGKPTIINQFFSGLPRPLPPLFERGPIVIFSYLNGIDPYPDDIVAELGNGIPNAAYGDIGYGLIESRGPAEVDLSGLPPVFNPDRNTNGILDVFEIDIDGDEKPDAVEGTGPNFFNEGLDYAAAQFELTSNAAGDLTVQMVYVAKLKPGLTVSDIKIHGSSTITAGATVGTGANAIAWDQTLLDDGNSDDGIAGDGVFARRVNLGSTANLKSYEVILFEPRRIDGETNPAVMPVHASKFPVTAPPLAIEPMSAPLWDPVTRVINRVGNPFGTVTSYTWTVTVFDVNGKPVYSTANIAGSEDTVTIPENAFDTTGSFSAKVIAKTSEQVPGYALFVINSPEVAL